jgi:hypothetical protein
LFLWRYTGMKNIIILICIIACHHISLAQTGTYTLKLRNGASCNIAIRQKTKEITADVFAWWNTASGTNGNYSGRGILQGNKCLLKNVDDADCTVRFTFIADNLKVVFSNCMASNLPDDFSGIYKKITGNIPGTYEVNATKAFFYKTRSTSQQLKTYLIKGDKVNVELENIMDNQWVFVNYINKSGQHSSGFILWSDLKKY